VDIATPDELSMARQNGVAIGDAGIAWLAGRQEGVVARRQLLALGMNARSVDHRLRRGTLHSYLPGVYAVGHRVVSPRGRLVAAVLAAGDGAVLSHRSAGQVWRLLRGSGPRVDVTAPRWRRAIPGVRGHSSLLPHDERTVHGGLPVTSVPRTLLDLAGVLRPRELERAVNEAEVLRLGDALSVPDIIDRHPRRHGVRALRAVLADLDVSVTRGELERRFRAFLKRRRLPRPAFNVAVLGYEVDCLWPEHRLIAELDGRSAHDTRMRFETDRARDRTLLVAGFHVVRITWLQLHSEPDVLEADLRVLLRPGATLC
jgi:very-short-patch-repair endonuclease